MVDFQEIEEVYKKLEGKIAPEEFRSLVDEKIAMLNGLCDGRTAAMLVAGEMGIDEIIKNNPKLFNKILIDFWSKNRR